MQRFTLTLNGTAPLIMHSARLSDPLDPAVKALRAVTGKRSKTDEDHEEIGRLEHAGGMYYDAEFGPYLPGDNLWRSLYDAAKKDKLGVKFKEAVVLTSDVNPLVYDGPRDMAGLWADKNHVHRASVKVQMARTIRTRPLFPQWATAAEGVIDTNVLDFADLERIAEVAGQLIGMGDWRPRFGRYEARAVAL